MAELENTTTVETTPETAESAAAPEVINETAELAKLRAEFAKIKAANDKLSKENAEKTKQLRAKQSAEEVAAEEAKALQQSMQDELNQLRKEKAVAATTAKLVTVIGNDEVATKVAEYLYGAEDVDAAISEINKAWTAKEKALRLEYGKIPAPSVGGSEGTLITKAQLDAMNYRDRAKFANEHPEDYRRLMGR